MKWPVRILVCLLSIMVPVRPAAAAPQDCAQLDVGPPGCILVMSWVSVVDHDSLTFFQLPARARYFAPDGAESTARFVPYCEWNVAGTEIIGDGLCIRAEVTCRLRGSDAVLALWMRLMPVRGGPPRMEGPVCFDGSSRQQLGPVIQQQVEDAIGAVAPPIVLQPVDAIVNLPMIASTDPRPPIVVQVNNPIAGVARATPYFAWDFGDGGGGIGAGVPYDGTSPTRDPGHYVAHTYRALGAPTVTVTVTWEVTFTIPGYDPIPLEDVVRTGATTTTIRTAHSELVDG